MKRATLIGIAVLALCACNQQNGLLDTPVSPTAPVPTPVATTTPTPSQPNPFGPAQPDVSTVNLAHSYVHAGNSLKGVVSLYGPAPETGATVLLSSSDPAASVPASVRIAPGARTGEFTLTTARVIETRHLIITGRTGAREAIAALTIFNELPQSYYYTADADEYIVEGGGVERVAAPWIELVATCEGNEVRLETMGMETDTWTLIFGAPQGAPLGAGTYDAVTQAPATGSTARLSVSGRGGRSCGAINGRFIVREIDLRNDRVNRLRLSFEQQCTNGDLHGWLLGEVNIADMPPSASGASCLR